MFALVAEVATSFVRSADLAEALRRCTEALVAHLDAAFARIWTVDESGSWLVLRASSGMYTHLDGGHARVEVGRYKIGLIAQERRPHLTNTVVGDPRVHDQEWARREGMVSFAGYPLVAGDRLVGVMAMFARHPLSPMVLEALGAVAEVVTVGVERVKAVELRVAQERAEEASRAKTEALNVVAHELRGPLSVMQVITDRIRRSRAAGRVEDGDWLERIDRQIGRLTRLVGDLLAAARLEHGQLVLAPRPTDLFAVISEIVMDVQERVPDHDLSLHAGDVPPSILVDPARIAQVVGNLLDNAVKYSPVHSPIDVRITRTADEVRVSVTDRGAGITPAEAEAIFEPFVRLGASKSRAAGLGLGLHISRLIVGLHGGRIGVDSQPGAGSTFWFTLPVRPG